jgi:hypothetical protein
MNQLSKDLHPQTRQIVLAVVSCLPDRISLVWVLILPKVMKPNHAKHDFNCCYSAYIMSNHSEKQLKHADVNAWIRNL